MRFWICALCAMVLAASPGMAGEADVLEVRVSRTGEDTFSFAVTVRHADTGWDHYADRWEVVAPDGTVFGTRVLLHPHVGEQPFTRSQSGIRIPARIASVTVRAHDTVHGLGGVERTVTLPR